MNNPSPLIPQGSLLEQRNKGRARVKIAVFLVLAIHGVGLMALLMQGCKKEPDAGTNAAALPEPTNAPAPAFVEPTNTPAEDTNVVAETPTNIPPAAPPPVEPPATPAVQPPPAGPATDYVIVKGDTFSTIAKKFHVSIRALQEANPAVQPTRLKIGQSIHVPAPSAPSAAAGGTGTTATADTGGSEHVYSVKSGDSLTKIAAEFGTSIRALRSANNLKTDKIVVGQKLKIPAKASAASSNPASAGTPSAQPPSQ